MGMDEEADRRREAAIASAVASLSPNFNPKSAVTQARLSKFQELHKRRLQIKAKSNVYKRAKGDSKGKSKKKAVEAHDKEPSKSVVDSTAVITENRVGEISSTDEDNVARNLAVKKRQKLHWGYSWTDFIYFCSSVFYLDNIRTSLTQSNGGNGSPICKDITRPYAVS
ncbi:hypothetical protein BUALT_Bualt04G0082600 [Buddleja alternifolia]|uniref:Uncharacterized protein n=1 Tax=Buddleja alternifolia TaxID=168488 RepID=A0AAV6XVC5_9LAMI|nr:hypothetical protein BUALT_Bualt04G0082600 [Buddleja alternifolia]